MTKNTGNRGSGEQDVKNDSNSGGKSNKVGELTGYARVSTSEQNLDRQLDKLKEYGCTKIFTDKISGSRSERPGYDEMLKYLRAGDTVVTISFSRLSRSLSDLLHKIEYFKENNISFVSLEEQIDTTTAAGELVLGVFGSIHQFTRKIILESSKAGIEAYRSRHERWGRPSKLSQNQQQTMLKLYRESRDSNTPKEERKTVKELLELFGISRSAFYEYVRKADNRSVDKKESNGAEVTEAKKKKAISRKPSKRIKEKLETTPKKPMEELYPGVDNESKELF